MKNLIAVLALALTAGTSFAQTTTGDRASLPNRLKSLESRMDAVESISVGFPIASTVSGKTFTLSAPSTVTALQGRRELVGPFDVDMYDYFQYDDNTGAPEYHAFLGFSTPGNSSSQIDADHGQTTWTWTNPATSQTVMQGSNAIWTAKTTGTGVQKFELALNSSNAASLSSLNVAGDAGAGWSLSPFAGLNNGISLYAFTPALNSSLSIDNEGQTILLSITDQNTFADANYNASPGRASISATSATPGKAAANHVDADLGVADITTGARPTCDSDSRGFRWYVQGASGVSDTWEVCAKDSNDAYYWATLVPSFQPALLEKTVTVTAAQIRTLFSSPLELLPATSNVFHGIERIVYRRQAGSGYTMGSAGNMLIRLNSVNYDAFASNLLLNGAGPYLRVTTDVNGGSSPYGAMSATTTSRDDTNKNVTLSIATADVTGGSGSLVVTIYYRDWTP